LYFTDAVLIDIVITKAAPQLDLMFLINDACLFDTSLTLAASVNEFEGLNSMGQVTPCCDTEG
jgi:hypothetical protein